MACDPEWKLIVGLGNPGPRYARNRHNAGFQCLDAFARAHHLIFTGLKARSRIARGVIFNHPVILAKPLTFINESGWAVRGLVTHYGFDAQDILVVHDDLDLPLGRIRLRPGGGAAGHKGVQSIINALGTDKFPRLRIGIGRPPPGMEVVDYVLGNFDEDELATMMATYDRTMAAIGAFLQWGIKEAMSQYNYSPQSSDQIGG